MSKSDDVAKYTLLKKVGNGNNWSSIFTMDRKEASSYEYFDTDVEILKKYSYKVKVEDVDGNASISPSVTVSINDSGERGKITNFALSKNNSLLGFSDADAISVNDLMKTNDKKFRMVELTWDYDYVEDLTGFSVYRSEGNEPFRLYKFFTIMELFHVHSWEEIPTDHGIIHCVGIDFDGRLNKVYKYKIQAKHDYGGYSLTSPIKYINILNDTQDENNDTNGGTDGH